VKHLIHQWHCDNAKCKNKKRKCLMLKEKHHALNSNHFSVWNKIINNEEVIIESSSLQVLYMFDQLSSSVSKFALQSASLPALLFTSVLFLTSVHVHIKQASLMLSMSSMLQMLMQSLWQYSLLYMSSLFYLSLSSYLLPYQHSYTASPLSQYSLHYSMHSSQSSSPQLSLNSSSKSALQSLQHSSS